MVTNDTPKQPGSAATTEEWLAYIKAEEIDTDLFWKMHMYPQWLAEYNLYWKMRSTLSEEERAAEQIRLANWSKPWRAAQVPQCRSCGCTCMEEYDD
jgi:hypothetical protein